MIEQRLLFAQQMAVSDALVQWTAPADGIYHISAIFSPLWTDRDQYIDYTLPPTFAAQYPFAGVQISIGRAVIARYFTMVYNQVVHPYSKVMTLSKKDRVQFNIRAGEKSVFGTAFVGIEALITQLA